MTKLKASSMVASGFLCSLCLGGLLSATPALATQLQADKPAKSTAHKVKASHRKHTSKAGNQVAFLGMGGKGKQPEEDSSAKGKNVSKEWPASDEPKLDDQKSKLDESQAAGGAAKGNEPKQIRDSEPGSLKPAATISVDTAKSQVVLTAPPPLVPDASLISVLKDLSRALKDAPEVAKLEDPCQKTAATVAGLALAKALERADLPSNRIISPEVIARAKTSLTSEAWDSGDIVLSPHCHASLSALWAKKIDGLLNLSVAGNCNCQDSPEGGKLGEFVFVLSGKSAVDKGFDIQSQQEVNYWLGKLTGISVDGSCCAPGKGESISQAVETKQNSTLVLKAVLTERGREHLSQLKSYQEQVRLLALATEDERKKAEDKAKAEAEVDAKAAAAAKVQAELEAKARVEVEAKLKAEAEFKAKAEAEVQARLKAEAEAKGKLQTESKAQSDGQTRSQIAMTGLSLGSERGWDSQVSPPAKKIPVSTAEVLSPDKAVAGQFVTVAVVNANHATEPAAELSFNGQTIVTGQDGKVLFFVPEDSPPGPSLQVALTSRPESAPHPVVILQPLATPSMPQVPHLDAVSPSVRSGGTVILEGHNFDGVADRNRVIIDGVYDARVLVASPVQLKADLPPNLLPGRHSVAVGTADLRSNPGQFEVIGVEVKPEAKELDRDVLTRLVVHINGTNNPVRVHLSNRTPEVIRLVKGNDQVVTTSGGAKNSVTVSVQRISRSPYQVQADLE